MGGFRPRIEDRTKVMVRARLRAGREETDACILDISTRGLAASSAVPLARGDFVELALGKHALVGQVKWAGERRFGIAFRERISVVAALSGEGDLVLPRQRGHACSVALSRSAAASAHTGGSRVEFAVFLAAGAMATFLLADYASAAMASLDTVETTLGNAAVTR